jgi:hypothetical protein
VPVRIVTLSGTIAAGAAATEIARATVPAGERWTIFEMRVWASAAGATYRIKHRHGASVITVTDQVTDVAIQYKLPYRSGEPHRVGDHHHRGAALPHLAETLIYPFFTIYIGEVCTGIRFPESKRDRENPETRW